MKLFFSFFILLLAKTAVSQDFNFYKGVNALGVKKIGLLDENGRELTGLKWSIYNSSELTQFDEPLAAVSEDRMNYYLINLKGERTSLFTFPVAYHNITDTRLEYKGDLKITYYMDAATYVYSDYRYYLNEDCACDPRPYYPCPARFPMDTVNASEPIKKVQQMQFVLEFYTLDSALQICMQLTDENPREPQYQYYKAWLIDEAFPVSYERFKSDNYKDDEFPSYMWDELIRRRDKGLIGDDAEMLMYLEQYEFIQDEVEKLGNRKTWFESNAKDATKFILFEADYLTIIGAENHEEFLNEENYEMRTRNYYKVIDALTEVYEYELDEDIILLTKAWQNRILYHFYLEHNRSSNNIFPYEATYKRNEKEILKSPHLYDLFQREKEWFLFRVNATWRNNQPGIGFTASNALVTRYNKLWTSEVSFGVGYNHFFINDTYGEFYLDFTLNPVGFAEMRFSPSILTNYDGTTGIGFLPTVGLRVWDIYIGYGYNFARKSKFEAIRGHSFGFSYGFTPFKSNYFIQKEDGYEL
ncbi:MAG: hypothetical protein ACI8ZM_002123 [Crocinitomix sp.]|jgi:hypothetical protein